VSAAGAISAQQLEEIVARVAAGKRVRRRLDGDFEIQLERPLPFLVLYRARQQPDDSDVRRLVTSGASWLIAPATAHAETCGLVAAIAQLMGKRFGAYLLLELWEAATERGSAGTPRGVRQPTFTVVCETLPPDDETVEQLVRALGDVPLRPRQLEVALEAGAPAHPPGLAPVDIPGSARYALHRVGLAMQPPYRQSGTGIAYPVVYRVLRRGLTQALRQTAFHFSVTHTTHAPPHVHALGTRRTSSEVKSADATLAGIASAFDFLLQVTPVNLDRAWLEFERCHGEREPAFDYRPLVVDAPVLKRALFSVETESIEDPTLAHLLDDARDELDRKVTMLTDRGTPRFLYGSLQVYGTIDASLLARAHALLETVRDREPPPPERLQARDIMRLAESELAWYRGRDPDLAASVLIRGDVSGLMVSNGNLLIGASVSISPRRAGALVQHEVGTHVLTHHNGNAQPLRLLATGLAGYEELQEGLAVTAEWMVNGLNARRLRLLAGRVLAAQGVTEGATFVESWRELTRAHGFAPHTAFTMCARVYRSGGFTKDVIYLRGLERLLRYFADGGAMEPLLVGKIAFAHVAMIEELRWRAVLREPRLMPRYLADEASAPKLARLRAGMTILDLLDGEG
jgi:uncharacterized protein (TIGR02421 family)